MVAGTVGPERGVDVGSKADACAIAEWKSEGSLQFQGLAATLKRTLWALTLGGAGLLADGVAELV